ncbi:MAG TPA: DUF488 domain-containing protein [Dyella sp.]|nr:DUF488 domain-containing protein [Dyella sp.]
MPSAASVDADAKTIWTVGHSTRTLDELVALLAHWRIAAVADVRRFPGSRRYPHFSSEALAESLPAHGLAYYWIESLGGRRQVQPHSPNTSWRNASFQGYADYMASAEFAQGLAQLLTIAAQQPTAIMCAEAVWWRCHRSMISDLLCVRGWTVMHIADERHTRPHPMTAPARIVDGQLSYLPADGAEG